MPEGDTLKKAAALLGVMTGQRVTGFESPLPALARNDALGATISSVEARGKNLLIWFDATRALYTHLRMEGSWHRYLPGTPWRKPARQARVILSTEAWIAVCFNAPVVEWLTAWQVLHHPMLASLGPDLLGDATDLEALIQQCLTRLRIAPERPLGEALLDQRLIAGLGNVYKSELLFIERLDPFQPVANYDDTTLHHLIAVAHKWMRRNLGPGPRQTRWGASRERTWVYGRSGELCPVCNATLQMRRQGQLGRSTYYCPVCQQVGAPTPRADPQPPPSRQTPQPSSPAARRPRGRVLVRGPAED